MYDFQQYVQYGLLVLATLEAFGICTIIFEVIHGWHLGYLGDGQPDVRGIEYTNTSIRRPMDVRPHSSPGRLQAVRLAP